MYGRTGAWSDSPGRGSARPCQAVLSFLMVHVDFAAPPRDTGIRTSMDQGIGPRGSEHVAWTGSGDSKAAREHPQDGGASLPDADEGVAARVRPGIGRAARRARVA